MMRMKLCAALVVFMMLAGCPNPTTGKIDPWLTAKTIINQSKLGIPIADTLFMQWELSQTDMAKVAKTKAAYTKVKLAVLHGMSLAYDGVVIAEQAKKDPDMAKLMDQAEKAWTDLRKFIEVLLKPVVLIKPAVPTTHPASNGPLTAAGAAQAPAMKLAEIDMSKLPKTLLPAK